MLYKDGFHLIMILDSTKLLFDVTFWTAVSDLLADIMKNYFDIYRFLVD